MAAALIAPDSSVLIAGYAPEHPFYEAATRMLPEVRAAGRLIAHTMAETYAVLTGQSHPPANVLRYMSQFMERAPVGLSARSYPGVLRTLAEGEILGASIYDGLIAASATEAGLRLLSLDRRAARTYSVLGTDYELLV